MSLARLTLADASTLDVPGVDYIAQAGMAVRDPVAQDLSNRKLVWTNPATVYTAIRENVTDTASSPSSLLMDLQVGGASKFKVDKFGGTNVNNIVMSGNILSAAWTTSGLRFRGVPSTFTDTTSSGTVAAAYTDVLGGNTIAASATTTFTDYATMSVKLPISGTNITIANPWTMVLAGGVKSTGQSITGSSSQSLFDCTTAWNTTGTPTGLKFNVSDTASATGSLLMDLQKGGVSQFKVDKFGNVTLFGLLYESAQIGVVAGTTRTQAGATQLVKEVSRIDTSTAPAAGTVLGDGVLMMTSVAGLDACLINNTANIITVYPLGADQINGLGAGVGIPIPPGDIAQFECAVAGDWRVEAGVGSTGIFDTVLACDVITAAGTNQAGAGSLPAVINRVTAGSGGVRLPASAAGLDVLVINHTGVPIQVYANGSDLVDDVAGSVGVAQMNGSLCLFACATTGNWYSNGIGTGYAGAYPTVSYTNGVTAFATGGQAGATLITTALARVTTVVTAGDSIKLPIAVGGMQITAFNASANSMNVFPNTGDAINALAVNTGYALTPGKTATFFSTVAGFWHALLSA